MVIQSSFIIDKNLFHDVKNPDQFLRFVYEKICITDDYYRIYSNETFSHPNYPSKTFQILIQIRLIKFRKDNSYKPYQMKINGLPLYSIRSLK